MQDQEKQRKASSQEEGGGASVESLQKELVELRDALSHQEESTQGYLEQIKRLQADFENWRKRVEQEKLFLVENGSAALVEKLLPVLDNFERALAAPRKNGDEESFRAGVEMIYKQLMDLLRDEGLKPIQSVGLPFDPALHEAFAYEERKNGNDHSVIEEARKGYHFKGRVLRPSLVKVSKDPMSVES